MNLFAFTWRCNDCKTLYRGEIIFIFWRFTVAIKTNYGLQAAVLEVRLQNPQCEGGTGALWSVSLAFGLTSSYKIQGLKNGLRLNWGTLTDHCFVITGTWQHFVLVEQTQCFHSRLQDRLESAQLRQKWQGGTPNQRGLVVMLWPFCDLQTYLYPKPFHPEIILLNCCGMSSFWHTWQFLMLKIGWHLLE